MTVSLRHAIAQLPRADNHRPGEDVALAEVYTVTSHRNALDPDRALVVGNRGMGKSFWAHALTNPEVRALAAERFRYPSLLKTIVRFGFNGSERLDPVAPTPQVLASVAATCSPLSLWRGVLLRACASRVNEPIPEAFADVVASIDRDPEWYARVITRADDSLQATGERLLLLFDALDRLATDWGLTRTLLQGLLQLTLTTQSFRSLRLKLFLRLDQFEDPRLFGFPDASKIQNTHVSLQWQPHDLYGLLFHRLADNAEFAALWNRVGRFVEPTVTALAGEFMGASEKRGRVVTWLPTHLADAISQISPRTFLTAWRVAGEHQSRASTPVDHLGILEGVRAASRDRLAELAEDYPWVRVALQPLSGQSVPLEQAALEDLWKQTGTTARVLQVAKETDKPILVPAEHNEGRSETALLHALKSIGVVEIRLNGKVNVPDIFRVEAGIKRRGGVRPPRRGDA